MEVNLHEFKEIFKIFGLFYGFGCLLSTESKAKSKTTSPTKQKVIKNLFVENTKLPKGNEFYEESTDLIERLIFIGNLKIDNSEVSFLAKNIEIKGNIELHIHGNGEEVIFNSSNENLISKLVDKKLTFKITRE